MLPCKVVLYRIDPAKNMHRFYRLDVQPDLFGGVLLMKEWGRTGAQGRIVAARFDDEALALAALQRQVERKRRREYGEHLTMSLCGFFRVNR